jgi:hypothetical protein
VRKVAATAISTRSYPARFVERSRIVTPLGRNCPGMEQFLVVSVRLSLRTASLKRRPRCVEATFSNVIWFVLNAFPDLSRVATPARNDSYADGTCAPLKRPAPRGATHDKLTSMHPICNGLCAFATLFAVCLSPPSNGSNVPERLCPTAVASRHRIATIRPAFSSRRRRHRMMPGRRRLRHQACDRASTGRFSIAAPLRTSGRDNARSRTG